VGADGSGMAPRRLLVRLGATAVAALALLPLVGCAPPDSVTFDGRGWGHGRGMSQWGALGYAVESRWGGTRILDHFYGGTTMATVSAPDQRVYLQASKGREMVVTQTAGRLRVDGYASDVRAVRVARLSSGRFRIWRGSSCTGSWTLVGDRSASEVLVRSSVMQGDDPTKMLQHCLSTGTRYYRGQLRAVDALGTIVTVNQVAVELMLRSIVPKEVSPYWADLGDGFGINAVRAQAVAARSYALSGDGRWGTWATTCDSTQCQVYAGYGSRTASGTSITKVEDPRTDAAVKATAGLVRRFPDGRIARTEFSSSSGGWTAGGAFPAVRDDGDDYSRNTNHAWTLTVSRATIEAKYDARQGRDLGTFLGFDSYVRNGLGELGGRVTRVRAHFSGGDVTLTGEEVRTLFGLKSSWFAT
jgi:SpoIID/LytB domain protein